MSDMFLRPGDVVRNDGQLWVVDYVNDCRASAVPVARVTREFVARVFKRDTIEEKVVEVAQKPKPANFSSRIERDEVLHHVPGYVRGQKVHVEDLPEAIRPVARVKDRTGDDNNEQRKEDSMAKRGRKPAARGGLAAVAKEAKAALGSLGGIMGFSATSVVRALGKHGVGAAHVRAIVKAQGVKMKDSTVSLQLNAGRNGRTGGKDGKPVSYPPLTKAQLDQLMESAPDPKTEENGKSEKAAAAEKAEAK